MFDWCNNILFCLLFIPPSALSAECLHKLQISSADIPQTFCRYSAHNLQIICRWSVDYLQIWYRCFTRSEADWEQICSFSISFVEEKQIWKGFKTYPKNLETTCLCYQILEIDWSIFHFTTKTTQPHPKVFSVNGALTCNCAALLTSLVD